MARRPPGRKKRAPALPDAGDLTGTAISECPLIEKLVDDFHGAAYRAHDPKLGVDVAIRVLSRALAKQVGVRTRFIRDSALTARLAHRTIPRIHKIGLEEDLDLHYVLSDLVTGTTLRDRVHDGGPVTPAEAIDVLRQACDALAVAHDGEVVHGDVCPRALYLADANVLKIIDFGLPRSTGDRAICTPYYASPEAFDRRGIDARSDVYSLGATAYYLLSGRPPHQGKVAMSVMVDALTRDPEPLTALNPAVPGALWAVIRRMLGRRPADRYQSMRDVEADLRRAGSPGSDDATVAAAPVRAASREWSVAPQDLSDDRALARCPRQPFEGSDRPVLGRHSVLALLGRGGMASVYLAANPRLAKEVAVKVLSQALMDGDPQFVDRFVREAQLAAALDSEHVVRVLDADRDETSGLHFLVMEYVKGDTASRCARNAGGRLSEESALDVCIAATRGLAAAHARGIVHRDVKPENVLVPQGPGGTPRFASAKLSDLGLARSEQLGRSLTGTSAGGMGTAGYMPPEQIRAAKYAREPADVFAMGATLYALLAGSCPFAGESVGDALTRTMRGEFAPLSTHRNDLRTDVGQLVAECLRPEPHSRPADASELLQRLESIRRSFAAVRPT